MEDCGSIPGVGSVNGSGVWPETPGRVAEVADGGETPANGGGSENPRCADDKSAQKKMIGGEDLPKKRLKTAESAPGRCGYNPRVQCRAREMHARDCAGRVTYTRVRRVKPTRGERIWRVNPTRGPENFQVFLANLGQNFEQCLMV